MRCGGERCSRDVSFVSLHFFTWRDLKLVAPWSFSTLMKGVLAVQNHFCTYLSNKWPVYPVPWNDESDASYSELFVCNLQHFFRTRHRTSSFHKEKAAVITNLLKMQVWMLLIYSLILTYQHRLFGMNKNTCGCFSDLLCSAFTAKWMDAQFWAFALVFQFLQTSPAARFIVLLFEGPWKQCN